MNLLGVVQNKNTASELKRFGIGRPDRRVDLRRQDKLRNRLDQLHVEIDQVLGATGGAFDSPAALPVLLGQLEHLRRPPAAAALSAEVVLLLFALQGLGEHPRQGQLADPFRAGKEQSRGNAPARKHLPHALHRFSVADEILEAHCTRFPAGRDLPGRIFPTARRRSSCTSASGRAASIHFTRRGSRRAMSRYPARTRR